MLFKRSLTKSQELAYGFSSTQFENKYVEREAAAEGLCGLVKDVMVFENGPPFPTKLNDVFWDTFNPAIVSQGAKAVISFMNAMGLEVETREAKLYIYQLALNKG